MGFEGTLEVENFISSLTIVDQKLFSWCVSRLLDSFSLVISLGLEGVLIDLCPELLASCLSQ